MKGFINEFKAFALRGNVLDMAVGVIIGAAFSGIVTSITENFINPILNLILGAETYTMADVAGFASNFITAVINFILTAFILFCLLKAINKMMTVGKKPDAPAAPTTKMCPYCRTEIALDACRCPNCTSKLEE